MTINCYYQLINRGIYMLSGQKLVRLSRLVMDEEMSLFASYNPLIVKVLPVKLSTGDLFPDRRPP